VAERSTKKDDDQHARALAHLRHAWQTHRERLARFVLLHFPRLDVEEVLQNVFADYWHDYCALGKAQNDEADTLRVLFCLTRNRSIDSARSNRRHEQRITEAELEEIPDDLERNSDVLLDKKKAAENCKRIIDKMPPDLREVFVLYEIDGLSGPEIAKIIGISEGTIRSRLHRAREIWKECVRQLMGGDQ
jgi:RNA polymerase sigma factor (sigma-70 family)